MISKKVWAEWFESLIEYQKECFPEIKKPITEKEIIDIMFKSCRTVYMQQLIIDVDEERRE